MAQPPFLGQVMLVPGWFLPKGYEVADGSLHQIKHAEGDPKTASDRALFQLIANRFGGDGKETFALPKLAPYCTVADQNESESKCLHWVIATDLTAGAVIPEAGHTIWQVEDKD
mmetsp:Transcript_25332/g.65439  ORF Transcript_25332/g.65439 Transcript_25332/m.65439 type:complete len:114 (+) Transcript_25332:77-418(+)